jgi:hypothetical protein
VPELVAQALAFGGEHERLNPAVGGIRLTFHAAHVCRRR